MWSLEFDVGNFHKFLLVKFIEDERAAGMNFDLSTRRLAGGKMQKIFDLSTG